MAAIEALPQIFLQRRRLGFLELSSLSLALFVPAGTIDPRCGGTVPSPTKPPVSFTVQITRAGPPLQCVDASGAWNASRDAPCSEPRLPHQRRSNTRHGRLCRRKSIRTARRDRGARAREFCGNDARRSGRASMETSRGYGEAQADGRVDVLSRSRLRHSTCYSSCGKEMRRTFMWNARGR